jgi:hypothetical protein
MAKIMHRSSAHEAFTAANSTNHDTRSFYMAMLKLSSKSVVLVPLFLPQENWSFDSGRNNGVVCANVRRNCSGSLLDKS